MFRWGVGACQAGDLLIKIGVWLRESALQGYHCRTVFLRLVGGACLIYSRVAQALRQSLAEQLTSSWSQARMAACARFGYLESAWQSGPVLLSVLVSN